MGPSVWIALPKTHNPPLAIDNAQVSAYKGQMLLLEDAVGPGQRHKVWLHSCPCKDTTTAMQYSHTHSRHGPSQHQIRVLHCAQAAYTTLYIKFVGAEKQGSELEHTNPGSICVGCACTPTHPTQPGN